MQIALSVRIDNAENIWVLAIDMKNNVGVKKNWLPI
jgi:hypothetical protein